MRGRSALPSGRGDFGSEIAFRFRDALAETVTHETGDLDRTADLAFGFLDRLRDRLLAGVGKDEGLLEQGLLLVERLETVLDDLLDHRFGLALLTEFVGEHVLLALHDFRIDAGRLKRQRV